MKLQYMYDELLEGDDSMSEAEQLLERFIRAMTGVTDVHYARGRAPDETLGTVADAAAKYLDRMSSSPAAALLMWADMAQAEIRNRDPRQ
jgi:hypothetical protein